MIAQQFSLLHDEHIYSWLVRQYWLSGYLSFQSFQSSVGLAERFLKPHQVLESPLSNCLGLVSGRFDNNLFKHTSFPLWQVSLPNVVSDKYTQLRSYSHMNEQQLFGFDTSWQSCSKCREEDYLELGITYWHVQHQLPSVFECQKHKTILERAEEPLRNLYNDATLPQHIKKWRPTITTPFDTLNDWQSFLLTLYKQFSERATFAMKLRAEIENKLLFLDLNMAHQKRKYSELNLLFESSIGEDLLNYLFRKTDKVKYRKVNVLVNLFTTEHQVRGIRSPIYWCAIAYWLRNELSILK